MGEEQGVSFLCLPRLSSESRLTYLVLISQEDFEGAFGHFLNKQ